MIERRCLRTVEDVELLKQAQPAGVSHRVEGLAPVNDVPLKSVVDPVIFQFPNISKLFWKLFEKGLDSRDLIISCNF